MSKYATFTGIGAAPEPPAPPPCPECGGRCCRNDLGYPLAHLNWDVGEHWCEHCTDGTAPAPVWTAEDERRAVVAMLRGYANSWGASPDEKRVLHWAVRQIQRGDHRKGVKS